MARIPAAELERLKSEVAVQRLVEAADIALKRSGKDWLGRCPFHADETASLVVSPSKNLWHCFGCGAAGGPIDWVMKLRGVSFRHAIELLRDDPASAAGSQAPVKQGTVRVLAAPVSLDADDHALLGQVIDYYHATLKENPEALAYLKKRGLNDPELITRFKLGYANRTLGLRLPHKNRVTGAQMRGRLEKVGIYRASGHEHFNGCLVVPVMDEAGRVQEVYGRKLLEYLKPGTPKHLYLPGPHAGVWNEIALSQAEVIVCEALIDAMTFWCAGIRNVTASYGIEGVTDELIARLAEQVDGQARRVLIAFDRDDAGERGAEKLAERLLSLGVDCYRVQFPKGMDANEYALKVQPAAKSLALLVRKAMWLGQGQAPERAVMESFEAPSSTPSSTASSTATPPAYTPMAEEIEAKEPEPEPLPLAAEESSAAVAVNLEVPAVVMPPAPRGELAVQASDHEVVMCCGTGDAERRWRVRGLSKNLAVGVLKLNVMVSNALSFHVDTLDLYAAKARALFLQQAAGELRVSEALLKVELGRVLLKLEALQDDRIQQALMPSVPLVAHMSEVEREAALVLLKSSDLLARILIDFSACGVVGEATNTLTAYLAATSRKLDKPLAVVIQSSSAAGKSSLMDAVLDLMPPEETVRYSAMSGQSLFYMGETNLKHKVLAIAEEEGASRASYALKLLQSDGQLTMASTGTDDNGNLVAQEYRVEGPMSLFMTTTAIDIDEELLNRCLVLSVDEGREQTAAIHRRQRERRTLAGLLGQAQREAIRTVHRNAQRLLRPLVVVNPYADQLTFLDDRTRTRRDHEKYLALIDAIALLHQVQRPIKSLRLGERLVDYIEVTLADIGHANALAHEVLGRSLDELPPQTRKLLAAIQQLVDIKAQALDGALQAVRFSRAEVRQHIGLSDTQCRVHLERLCNLEYLLVHRGGRGQCFEYELLFDGQPQADAPHLAGLIDVTKIQGAGSSTIVASRGKGGMNAEPSRVQRALETASTRVASTGVDTAPLLDVGSESRHPGHHGRPNGALYPAVPLAAKG